MRWSIGKRLFAALTISSLVIVGLNAVATRWSFEKGFIGYLSAQEDMRLATLADDLIEIYQRDDSWQGIVEDPRVWADLLRPPRMGNRPRNNPRSDPRIDDRRRGGPRGRGPFGDPSELFARVALYDQAGNFIAGRDVANENVRTMPVTLGGRAIAELRVIPHAVISQEGDLQFARKQRKAIVWIGIGVLALAAFIAALLAKQLVRPISALAQGTRALTQGDYDERITETRDDEIGDLARDFNRLAQTLEKNQQSRRQWVSDISHELRTPLAILSGELQAIEDGVRKFDEGTRSSLQAEVQRLNKLVNDLHELTISDEGGIRYHFAPVNLAVLIDDLIETSRTRMQDAGLTLTIEHADDNPTIMGDSLRLEQSFSNLIENSIRYTDAPGELTIRTSSNDDRVSVEFADSAPGVTANELPRLFDRLYRVDSSRNRASGGSGLGLSICAAIVHAHDGTLTAEQSNLGGISIRMEFPKTAPV